MFAYIRFPIAGGFADGDISAWAHQTHQNAEDEMRILREANDSVEGEIKTGKLLLALDCHLLYNDVAR